MSPQTPPAGFHALTPYLVVGNAAAAIDFYKQAFGAVEVMRFEHGGRINHAEIRIGDSPVMLSDAMPEMGHHTPDALGGTPVGLMLYVDDVDAVFARAVAAGGIAKYPVKDQFYGDRSGTLTDPFGHQWTLATHIEDVKLEEVRRRFEGMLAGA